MSDTLAEQQAKTARMGTTAREQTHGIFKKLKMWVPIVLIVVVLIYQFQHWRLKEAFDEGVGAETVSSCITPESFTEVMPGAESPVYKVGTCRTIQWQRMPSGGGVVLFVTDDGGVTHELKEKWVGGRPGPTMTTKRRAISWYIKNTGEKSVLVRPYFPSK